jgi:hypothetical protein
MPPVTTFRATSIVTHHREISEQIVQDISATGTDPTSHVRSKGRAIARRVQALFASETVIRGIFRTEVMGGP